MQLFGLADCNNFYCSCERVFRPDLNGKPVVVLSNNDGCVIARSNEAKALGIQMGIPFYQAKEALQQHNVAVFSSNYVLYGDMSRRVMALLSRYTPHLDIYSIDEAFLDFSGMDHLQDYGKEMVRYITKGTGIPLSLGIAPTKTLAKVANKFAKKYKGYENVCLIDTDEKREKALRLFDVSDVWGIGRKLVKKLNFMGIFTAAELAAAPHALIRQSFGILTEKTLQELNGIPCIGFEDTPRQKSILCSRSFETEINGFENLKKIIAEFVDNACLRLREQNGLAGGIVVFIATNRFHEPYYNNSKLVGLPEASCHTAKFTKAMTEGLKSIYRPEFYYKRAGIMLVGIEDAGAAQKDFLISETERTKETELMKAVDAVNRKLGRKTLYFGAQEAGIRHYIKRGHKSPSYTTSWNDLPQVH